MWKPVKARRGRATVIDREKHSPFESSNLPRESPSVNGTRYSLKELRECPIPYLHPRPSRRRFPLGEILPWAIFAGILMLLAIYFIGAEEGATSLISGMYVHEFVHDGRHLLGFPCH